MGQKFTRSRGNPASARYAYLYSLRVTVPSGEWYEIEGTLRSNTPLNERRIKQVLVADLMAEVKDKKGITLRLADVSIDHFTYAEAPRGGR